MIFKKFNKKPKTVTWKDINLGQFMEMEKIIKSEDYDKIKELKIQKLLYGEQLGDLNFMKTPILVKKCEKYYKINGIRYNIQADLTKLNVSQYIDYINGKTMLDWLSVIMIPQNHSYNDGYDMEEIKEDILQLPIIECNAISFFLKRQLVLFIEITNDFLKNQLPKMQEMKEEEKQQLCHLTQFLTSYTQFVENLI